MPCIARPKRPHLAGVQIARVDFDLAQRLASAKLWSIKTTVGVAIRRLANEHGVTTDDVSALDRSRPTGDTAAGKSRPKRQPVRRGS